MSERPDTVTCRKLAKTLQGTGLRPVIDPDLDVVRIDCPNCGAQDRDPLGMWRPARAVPRGQTLTVICTACGEVEERPR